ncbi:site-specific integrase [Hymenobacter swuensis]|uniref:Tyr recombinase domain-containing protein n=1 Tax=Hymenobacter swuensis DY53 TaxID=1227739 RepID=W8EZD1_9BACT|nr:site-specific integrase [Hymenobacter swuensis]AHJ98439.1 hypothetical protein Hsw_2844 [Hymenobacter swuensis DY53]
MLRTKFYLTDAQSASPTAIYAACYLDGKRKKLYTPLSVLPSQWDSKAQLFRRSFANYSNANRLLRFLVTELDDYFLATVSKGKLVLIEDLRTIIARILTGAEPPEVTFTDHLSNWIEDSKRDVKPSTIKSYITFRNHILAFGKAKRYALDFSTLDLAFSEAFKNYLLQTARLTNTSVNNVIKNLKVFLNATHNKGLHEFQHHTRFKKLEGHTPELMCLSKEEKAAIIGLNLDYFPRLEKTRDVFLFGCETGLRFSDIIALSPHQVHKDYILLTTQKTNDFLKVPLSSLAHSILKKYAGKQVKALPAKTNQKTNADLKQIAKLARLEALVSVATVRGTDRQKLMVPKWNLLCTHTARRTFVTLALEAGMRPEVVMRITGHKNYRTLHQYTKITDSVVQDEFLKLLS